MNYQATLQQLAAERGLPPPTPLREITRGAAAAVPRKIPCCGGWVLYTYAESADDASVALRDASGTIITALHQEILFRYPDAVTVRALLLLQDVSYIPSLDRHTPPFLVAGLSNLVGLMLPEGEAGIEVGVEELAAAAVPGGGGEHPHAPLAGGGLTGDPIVADRMGPSSPCPPPPSSAYYYSMDPASSLSAATQSTPSAGLGPTPSTAVHPNVYATPPTLPTATAAAAAKERRHPAHPPPPPSIHTDVDRIPSSLSSSLLISPSLPHKTKPSDDALDSFSSHLLPGEPGAAVAAIQNSAGGGGARVDLVAVNADLGAVAEAATEKEEENVTAMEEMEMDEDFDCLEFAD